jgi:hypothetical protein
MIGRKERGRKQLWCTFNKGLCTCEMKINLSMSSSSCDALNGIKEITKSPEDIANSVALKDTIEFKHK